MFKSLPKNLLPRIKSKQNHSKILEIIEETLDKPITIPNYLNRDSPFTDYNIQLSPYNNSKHISNYLDVDKVCLNRFFNKYQNTKDSWENVPFTEKKDIFLGAADLLENKYYEKMMAYTMVGQNKNFYEAEIDSICELVDFLRFNVSYAETILKKQPLQSDNIVNISEYNSLKGFVASITPFNFTAIGGNLASAPLLFSNIVLWKPSDNSILSNYLFYEIMREAGLPEGVLNFCPMEPNEFVNHISERPDLAALLFTGSSQVFDSINAKINGNMENRNCYPRIIGETGGKNFHFVDKSCEDNLEAVVRLTMESAFNYSGQKCSACSILYIPEHLLSVSALYAISMMPEFTCNGVINERSYNRITEFCEEIYKDEEVEIIHDGNDSLEGQYYIHPKIFLSRNHNNKLFHKELFAPILTIYPYKDSEKEKVMDMVSNGNNYSLTGSIFSKDDKVIKMALDKFRHKTGNFYINDKSTGSIVGQQPFGGSGKSGTNDKAGDINLLFRLFNQRNIKINHDFY